MPSDSTIVLPGSGPGIHPPNHVLQCPRHIQRKVTPVVSVHDQTGLAIVVLPVQAPIARFAKVAVLISHVLERHGPAITVAARHEEIQSMLCVVPQTMRMVPLIAFEVAPTIATIAEVPLYTRTPTHEVPPQNLPPTLHNHIVVVTTGNRMVRLGHVKTIRPRAGRVVAAILGVVLHIETPVLHRGGFDSWMAK